VYLARIFGIAQLPAAPLLLAGWIDVHRTTHHRALAAGQPPPAPNLGAAAGGGAIGGVLGGGAAGPPPGDDTGGFTTALLSAAQVTALLAVPVGTLRSFLDFAGVPHSPAQVGSALHVNCTAAAWAAEKRRSAANVRALDSGIQARLLDAFEVPAAWRPNASIQAAVTVPLGCRDSAWALDPTTSFSLVHPARSALFRLQEGLASVGTHDSADTCEILSETRRTKPAWARPPFCNADGGKS
jgi:hypothetical protein